MKQHLVAFGGAAQDYSAGLVTVPVVADGLIRISSNVMQLNQNWDVSWSWFGGVNLSRVRLNSAQSRIRGYPNLVPVENAALGGSRPLVNDIRANPVKLYEGENVSIQATNAASVTTVGGISLVDPSGQYTPPPPTVRKVRFTAAPVCVAFGWSTGVNVTLDDDLEAGWYDVFGLVAYEATAIFARLVFRDQVEKPGCLATQSAVQEPGKLFMGGIGKMGEFQSITPPFIEVFANAAATTAVVGYLLLGKQR